MSPRQIEKPSCISILSDVTAVEASCNDDCSNSFPSPSGQDFETFKLSAQDDSLDSQLASQSHYDLSNNNNEDDFKGKSNTLQSRYSLTQFSSNPSKSNEHLKNPGRVQRNKKGKNRKLIHCILPKRVSMPRSISRTRSAPSITDIPANNLALGSELSCSFDSEQEQQLLRRTSSSPKENTLKSNTTELNARINHNRNLFDASDVNKVLLPSADRPRLSKPQLDVMPYLKTTSKVSSAPSSSRKKLFLNENIHVNTNPSHSALDNRSGDSNIKTSFSSDDLSSIASAEEPLSATGTNYDSYNITEVFGDCLSKFVSSLTLDGDETFCSFHSEESVQTQNDAKELQTQQIQFNKNDTQSNPLNTERLHDYQQLVSRRINSFASNAESEIESNYNIERSMSSSQLSSSSHWLTLHLKDFQNVTWNQTLEDEEQCFSAMGLGVVMAATVVIHPFLFFVGAGTAVWAVGAFHATEKGDGSFQRLFWDDNENTLHYDAPRSIQSQEDMIRQQEVLVKEAKRCAENIDSESKLINPNLHESPEPFHYESDHSSLNNTFPKKKSSITAHIYSPLNHKEGAYFLDTVVQQHFPPLENRLVKDEYFLGINAHEFFQVFFSDNAPYSLREFQQKRGDTDLKIGLWKQRCSKEHQSFHAQSINPLTLPSFPACPKKQRVLTFKTLTKSYFGPTYASAKKTMNVTIISKHLIIIESKTELFDIPFHDRFFVLERWIVETSRNDSRTKKTKLQSSKNIIKKRNNLSKISQVDEIPVRRAAKLAVYAQVFMLRDCNWERQIKSKSLSTLTEIVKAWCKKATQALDLTLKKKLDRIEMLNTKTSKLSPSKNTGHGKSKIKNNQKVQSKEALMKIHQKKLKDLEKKFAGDDFDCPGIEVTHSTIAGKNSAFARILNPSGACIPISCAVVSDKISSDMMTTGIIKQKKGVKGVLNLFNKKKKT